MIQWKILVTVFVLACGGQEEAGGGLESEAESEAEGESESEDNVCNPNDPTRHMPWYTCEEQLLPDDFGAPSMPIVGSTVPSVTSTDQFGNAFDLYDLYGDIVAFDICASFAVNCIAYADQAEDLYQEYGDRGVVFLSVITDVAAASWADAHGLTFPVVDDADSAIATAFDVTGVPTFFVLDRALTIADTWVKQDVTRMRSAIELLAP